MSPMSRSISPKSGSLHQHQHQHQQAESSADEITPIVNRERGGAKDKNYNSTSTRQFVGSGVPGASRHSSSSSTRRRKAGQSGLESRRRDIAADEDKDRGSWWREVAEKYGSVELENKGSVARDHLALGVSKSSLLIASFVAAQFFQCSHRQLLLRRLILARTHLFGLASYIPRFRFNRYRRNSALPAQYYHFEAGRLYPYRSRQHLPFAPGRKAIGSYLSRNCNLSFAARREEIL